MITLLNKNKLFLYCLVVIISSSFFASLIQTSFGKVDVKLMNLKTPDGQNLVYDLYKPSIATEDDKQPFIVVVPGFQRSKEALSNIAIELSRRGYVVALIDPYAQGMSSSSLSRLAATTQGYGMFALVDYAYAENFSFIDINKIGSTGHSMGGNAAIRGADYFGKEAIKSGKKSKLDSVYISGYVLTLRENILRDSKSNMGVSYALYDEGAFRNDLQGWDAGNMKIAPESLRTVNSGLPKDKKVTEVELGKYYGERSNNTLRVIFNEELLHPFQPYNKEATKNQLDYFDKVFGAPISINSNNQIWQYKELFTLINMIVSLLMLIPIAKLFLSLNFYKDIVKDIPATLPEQTSKSKMILLFPARIREDANWAPAEPAPKIATLLIFLDLYVLRRILRRAIRHSNILGFQKPFMNKLSDFLVDEMGSAYPELNDQPFLLMNADVLSEIDLSKLPQGTNFAHLIATHNPDHNNNGDFSIDNDVVVINENQNDFTWSGISIINPKILIPHLGKSYPFDLWKDILIPLVDDKKITAHHDEEFWVDVGNSDRLALARKHFKEEN